MVKYIDWYGLLFLPRLIIKKIIAWKETAVCLRFETSMSFHILLIDDCNHTSRLIGQCTIGCQDCPTFNTSIYNGKK